jgi:hypothetical protein
MCRPTDALRHILGIRDYAPGPHPHARVRKPTWHGARSTNGHAPGLDVIPDPAVARLAREHRLIRQMLADAARWARGANE